MIRPLVGLTFLIFIAGMGIRRIAKLGSIGRSILPQISNLAS